jgi:hypothetical protein
MKQARDSANALGRRLDLLNEPGNRRHVAPDTSPSATWRTGFFYVAGVIPAGKDCWRSTRS